MARLTVERLAARLDAKAAADLLKASPAVQRKIVTAYRENPEFRRRGWALTMPPTPGSHRHPWLKNHRA